MQLLGPRIIVEVDQESFVEKNGLILPSRDSKAPNNRGTIRSVSVKVDLFRPGDRIVFQPGVGKGYRFNGKDMLIMFDTDVISKI